MHLDLEVLAREVGTLLDFTDRQCAALEQLFRLVSNEAFGRGLALGATHPERLGHEDDETRPETQGDEP